MDPGTITAIVAFVGVVGTISGIVLGWAGRSRALRQETVAEASKDARMMSDIEYIKRGIDDARFEIKDQGRQFDELSKQVVRIDESVKSAHKRIDRIEGRNEP